MADTGISIDIPDELLVAARDQRLSLFIGAGFSKNISTDIPDASQLIEVAAERAQMDPRLLGLHARGDYMLAAEYLEIVGGLRSALSQLEQKINNSKFSVEKSRPHIQLTELKSTNIFTTNWDSWIEKAFLKQRKPFELVRAPADLLKNPQQADVRGLHRHRIIKYHGDFAIPESVVFSMRSYFARILNHSVLDSILETDIFANSLLFVGYSFSDPNLRLVWQRILRQRAELDEIAMRAVPKSFILSNDVNPIMTAWLQQLGIAVIPVDPTPTKLAASIEYLFDRLIGAQKG
jgi:hypothetical protein